MDKLLKASMDNIEKTTKAREIDQQIYVLKETIAEIWAAKQILKDFTDIRNETLKNLHASGVSVKELSKISELSTVFIHRVIK
tara:strand:- start:327 stop:575 length:249 start_codon:yes stop_codon:yes gene_type:complete